MDNIRFLLIFTVVFAHLLEIAAPFAGHTLLYKIIYSFHMPAFIFMFGYFSKFSIHGITFRWCIPYLIFQSLYILFANYILGNSLSLQYATPYWLLWYMLACIFYQLLIPLLNILSKRWQSIALLIFFALALVIGFVDSIGYFLSLSRFFVFLPWFLLGFYFRKYSLFNKFTLCKKHYYLSCIISLFLVLFSIIFIYHKNIPNELLYGSYSYFAANSTVWMRAALFLAAFGWITLLFIVLKPFLNRKFIFLTSIGQNTLPIFLLHGFIVKATAYFFPGILSNPLRVILFTCLILLLFGNRFSKRAFDLITLSPLYSRGKNI